MGMMKFEVPHALPKAEARKRVEQLLNYWGAKYGVNAQWTGDGASLSGKVMGIKLDAHFEITDSGVKGEGTDPGLLLRNQAKQYLQKKFAAALDPSQAPKDFQDT